MELRLILDNTQRASESIGSRYVEAFEQIATSFCFEARNQGRVLVPTHDDFKKFKSLSQVKQQEIVKTFIAYYKVLRCALGKGVDIHDSLSTVWWAIRELGLRPPSDLFNHLEKEDIVEIYSPDHIQVFRSFNFFDLTSYSIEDIFSYSWSELYSRSDFITQEMIEMGSNVISGKVSGIVMTSFPLHAVVDKFSPDKDWSLIRHKLFAQLKSSDNRNFIFNAFKVMDRKDKGH